MVCFGQLEWGESRKGGLMRTQLDSTVRWRSWHVGAAFSSYPLVFTFPSVVLLPPRPLPSFSRQHTYSLGLPPNYYTSSFWKGNVVSNYQSSLPPLLITNKFWFSPLNKNYRCVYSLITCLFNLALLFFIPINCFRLHFSSDFVKIITSQLFIVRWFFIFEGNWKCDIESGISIRVLINSPRYDWMGRFKLLCEGKTSGVEVSLTVKFVACGYDLWALASSCKI